MSNPSFGMSNSVELNDFRGWSWLEIDLVNRPGSARPTPLQQHMSAPSMDSSQSMLVGTGMGMVQGSVGVRMREGVLQGGARMTLTHGRGSANRF